MCVCSDAASTLHLQLMQPTKDTPSRAGDCQPCGWRKKKRPPELGALFPLERSPDTYTYGAAVNSIPFRCSLRLFAALSFPSVMARAASRCKWNASHKQCVSMKLLEWKLIPSQWIEPLDGWMVRFQVIITVKMLDVEMEHIGKYGGMKTSTHTSDYEMDVFLWKFILFRSVMGQCMEKGNTNRKTYNRQKHDRNSSS